ncbi:hypothetical protein [Kineococcus rubinsiae]|uniref:hypothetical protein n=1 Tax=Kineococcus rubinsiae TaxID=2609562 RepID=UPI0014322203|nr:hypothetical protein [Kineococcus rubinsiae]
MTVLHPAPAPPSPTTASRVLRGVAVACVAALAATAVGLLLDDRTITGAPAWLKPAKFAVSIAVYCATLAWVLRQVTGHRRAVAAIAWTTGVALVVELLLIGLQVARGTTSHFNDDTPFDAAVFSAMGGFVALVFLAAAAAAVLLLRQRGLPRTLAAGLRGGLLVSLLGMAEAGLMLANRTATAAGAHTVGAPDGGPGLPVTGWSTAAGDLRVAHFAGLHGLQVLLLLAWALHRWAPGLADRTAARLVTVASAGYAGGVVLLAWQALRGLPLLRPDTAVGLAALGWALAVAVAGGLVLRRRAVAA